MRCFLPSAGLDSLRYPAPTKGQGAGERLPIRLISLEHPQIPATTPLDPYGRRQLDLDFFPVTAAGLQGIRLALAISPRAAE